MRPHCLLAWAAAIGAGGVLPLAAQVTLTGRVTDERSNEPLAFVHVVAHGVRDGATTGLDGRFSLPVPALPAVLRFSYVGYQPVEVNVVSAQPIDVRMRRASVELPMVEVLPGENPAHRIIDRVRANRRMNDGMRHRAHRYTSYSKTVFTAALDSAILHDPQKLAALDSNQREAIDWLDKQHLLLIESATKKSFLPPASEKEEVIAMRVSGLKDPSMLALAASTKTFSIYEPQIALGEKTYLSPIGPNSTERYLFILQDTLFQGSDTVFIISYRPRSGRKFDALKGVLHVNTGGYALQHIIAEPVERTGNASIKLQQRHARVGGTWFPVELVTFLYFDFINVENWKAMGVGRTTLKDIEVDAPVTKREVRGPEFVMERMAARRDSGFWAALRTDTLDRRELRTYHTIDSLSEAEHIERKVRWFGYLTTGRMGLGPFDLLLDKLIAFNRYEGFRPGLGAATNDRLSRHATLGGYFAYGIHDQVWKWGGDLTIKPWPGRGPTFRGHYANDVDESGGVRFQGTPLVFTNENYRWLYVDRLDRIERYGGELAFRVNSSLRMWVGSEFADRLNTIGYRYARRLTEEVTLLQDRFITGSVSVGVRFAFRERVARLPGRQFGLGTRWPILYANAMRAVKGLWGGEWDLWRVNAMLEKTFRLRMAGELSMRLMAGMATANAPYPFLFNLRGTYDPRSPLATQNTFETMRPNEFLASHYAALFLRHSFGNLLFKWRKFRPVPVLVANAGWGVLAEPDPHRGFAFEPFDAGHYEAGVRLDNLLRSGFTAFGAGAYYRLGPERSAGPADNLAVKLTVSLGR